MNSRDDADRLCCLLHIIICSYARGFAHGFAVLSETAIFQYKCDNFYTPQADGGISIKDGSLGIDWKIPTENAILSDKDINHLCLKDFDSPFD